MNFQEQVKINLGTYRKKYLGIKEMGVFPYGGRELPQEHILPKVTHPRTCRQNKYLDLVPHIHILALDVSYGKPKCSVLLERVFFVIWYYAQIGGKT